MKRSKEYFRGCLLGGAIGDALGWPVEFLRLNEIKKKYGESGITDLITGINGKAEITDDTQMTLFTAEGLLRAETRRREEGICHLPSIVYHAYLRWLHTQGYPQDSRKNFIYDGWLMKVKELYVRRGPGNTCLSALSSGRIGTIELPINNSKGCGGVMRVAPIGLFCRKEEAFQIACDCAALTHGHPSGYLSAGVLAHVIACIIEGADIEEAVKDALLALDTYDGKEECSIAVKKAVELANSNEEPDTAIKLLGEGWVGEEAIAISIYCALRYRDDFRKALCAAVNHDGDSDSTGAITGNVLGAYLGINGIPEEWVANLEMADVIMQIADDLLIGFEDTHEWRNRYPG
jgi:ADP-ribosylglycohydrolase